MGGAVGRGAMLYVGTRDRIVYALDATDGAVKWTFKPRRTPFSLAEGHDGAIYVGSYDGNIYSLDPTSGRVRWTFSTGKGGWGENPVHALAVGSDGVLYAGVGTSVEAIVVVSSQKEMCPRRNRFATAMNEPPVVHFSSPNAPLPPASPFRC